ncbi:MAG: hypothetical protein IPK60_04290 [Sandaracinaceae bacterium]|nr:hypothetical protein [Sandaracinaceae bacterium]
MAETTWRTLQDRARYAKSAGDWAGACESIREALVLASDASPVVKADLYNALADYCRNASDLNGALAAAQSGLKARRGTGSATLVGNDLMMLAQVHEKRNEPAEASTCAKEARSLYATAYGEDHAEVKQIDAFLKGLAKG